MIEVGFEPTTHKETCVANRRINHSPTLPQLYNFLKFTYNKTRNFIKTKSFKYYY